MLLRLLFGLVAMVSDSSASQARSINSESQCCSIDTGVGSGDAAEVPEVEEVSACAVHSTLMKPAGTKCTT